MTLVRVAILTVSDTASADRSTDRSGPTIRDLIAQHISCQIPEGHYRIVADDVAAIQSVVTDWTSSNEIDWVITTGGTGFGMRDVTPEAIAPLIERPAPGLVHLMLSASLDKTPLAALARPVAGTIKKTLVTTLPGSPKAVTENLEALLQGGVLEHAIDLIKGGSGKQVHAALSLSSSEVAQTPDSSTSASTSDSQSSDHHHHHHYHSHSHSHNSHSHPRPRSQAALSHDPSAPVPARHRKSPFPQITLENALQLIRQNIQLLPIETLSVDYKLGGRILAEDVYAPQDIPIRATTSVDGYALRSTDPPGTYTVLTSSTHTPSSPLPPGSIFRINTGAPLPLGTDTVIMVEDTELISTYKPFPDSPPEEKEVRTLVQVPEGENMRAPGSDMRKGDVVRQKGELVGRGGGDVGVLVFVGRKEVRVYKKPVVALMSTGNELVDLHDVGVGVGASPSKAEEWGGIYDTNRPSLRAVLESLGYEVIDLGIVPDDITSHLNTLTHALHTADVVLTTGGTSMGPTDLLKPIIERYLGGTIHFGRVGVKPGKPTTFGVVPVSGSLSGSTGPDAGTAGDAGASGTTVTTGVEGNASASAGIGSETKEAGSTIPKPIFALPGNPASALVMFYVFVLPALRRMGGFPERLCELPRVVVQIQNPMPLDPRVEFHRVIIKSFLSTTDTGSSMVLKAYSTGGQRSSRVASLAGANGLVVLPTLAQAQANSEGIEGKEGKTGLETSEFVEALVIGEIEMG